MGVQYHSLQSASLRFMHTPCLPLPRAAGETVMFSDEMTKINRKDTP